MAKATFSTSSAKRIVRGVRLAESANRSGRRARRIAVSVGGSDQFVGFGRKTGETLIGGEANRWQYTGVYTVEDDTDDVLTFIDTEESWTAQNLAEVHNNGASQESNGVTVGSGVSLIPIMDDRVVKLYRRRRTGLLYFEANNDVECD